MTPNDDKESPRIVSLSDFLFLCRKHKRKIVRGVFIGIAFTVLYGITQPVEYKLQATFREKSASSLSGENSLSSLLLGAGGHGDSEALSVLKSRSLLEKLIKSCDLQASLKRKEGLRSLLDTVKNNLSIQMAMLRRRPLPVFPKADPGLELQNLEYAGEVPLTFRIIVSSDDSFQIAMRGNAVDGHIGVPIVFEGADFKLVRTQEKPLEDAEYVLKITPMTLAVTNVRNKLTVKEDINDLNLVHLQYFSENRYKGAVVLNTCMDLYQEYLREQHQHLLDEQVAYLHRRQDDMQSHLSKMMQDYADNLASEMTHSGFPTANAAMEFLAKVQQEYSHRLRAIDLDLKSLRSAQEKGTVCIPRCLPDQEAIAINALHQQISQLMQQADSMALVLHEEGKFQGRSAIPSSAPINQLAELESVQRAQEEVQQILSAVQAGDLPQKDFAVLNDPRYLIGVWCNALEDKEQGSSEQKRCLKDFAAYLGNVQHLMHLQENAIRGRLTHQQAKTDDFQGIDLELAKRLYVEYSKENDLLQGQHLQTQHVMEQMHDPSFEISSLSTVLNDPVSQKMISAASALVLELQDTDNRSAKEQERLRHQLLVQKGFLGLHLDQTLQLLALRREQFQLKISALQQVVLGLMQKEATVLRQHLTDHIQAGINSLEHERSILQKHQRDQEQEIAQLPQKWVAEKLIEQQMNVNKLMLEELGRVVESKNTISRLEVVQSTPLDQATAMLPPDARSLVLLAGLGGFAGGVLVITVLIVQALTRGMPVSPNSLRLAGLPVAGSLSSLHGFASNKPLRDQDLSVLRRLVTLLEKGKAPGLTKAGTVLLFLGHGPDYSIALSSLMAKKGQRVLLLPLSFDHVANTEDQPGLLQFLEGEAARPNIQHYDGYDRIASGGVSRFAHELLGTARFDQLLEKYAGQYDWVIATAQNTPKSAEGEALMRRFTQSVVTIDQQKWPDISPVITLTGQTPDAKNLIFIFLDVCN